MSKYTTFENKKSIPLNYNDNIRASNRNWSRIQLTLKSELTNHFGISGQFPVFISSIYDETKLVGIDLKIGDNIMMINGQNVSRACAKSIRKIFKSSKSIVLTVSRPDQESLTKLLKTSPQAQKTSKLSCLINLFKKNKNCISIGLVKEPKEMNKKVQQDETINYCYQIDTQSTEIHKIELSDCGYYSIPTSSKTSTISSVADLEYSNPINFKTEIESFLSQIQQAIDTYVRPCMMLNVLAIEESLVLFQNIEKLIPVTKFLDNIINSTDNGSGWYSSLKIVFDAFKVYLTGISNAINLLEELTLSNKKFINFINKIGEKCSYKLMDFLFLPIKFIQDVVDYLIQSEKITEQYCSEIRQHVYKTFAILEDNLDDSITQVSDCSSFQMDSVSNDDSFPIMVKPDGSNEWQQGDFIIHENQLKTDKLTIEPGQIEKFKHSKNNLILLIQTKDIKYFALEFVNEQDKNVFVQKIN